MVVSLIVGCVLGLAVVLYLYLWVRRPFENFASAAERAGCRARVLVVTAHPDDECMFFGPTVLETLRLGHHVFLLCLSTGNFEKKGDTRLRELYQSAAILGVPAENVTIVDDPDLPDDMNKAWDTKLVAQKIMEHVIKTSANVVITFDPYGVSSHKNHSSLYHGVNDLVSRGHLPENILVYALESVSLLRKYTSFLDVLPSTLSSASTLFLSGYPAVLKAQRAMCAHRSQLVWFRWLYIAFSRYMVINTLRPLGR
ncbi:PREDICTED: N-acetylglucosaminyl-phosphatidylinositol de-N-acetylase-like [Branchiostoma belcheri]|uniref:N-acetylglucosaminylphosphatidylinositol deacetylase n=1 Tax=Branchiostoma belcheri TaxID=7741 RepID=A0A6P4ZW52_BRABE|nr:PREDICTED: N-acetylglucosaminyl-phosphatidylinositol de-N-acetylase-like [Branchiostoma belcheri]